MNQFIRLSILSHSDRQACGQRHAQTTEHRATSISGAAPCHSCLLDHLLIGGQGAADSSLTRLAPLRTEAELGKLGETS